MKITKAKIKRELEKKGWNPQRLEAVSTNDLIKDVLTIIDAELQAHKGISIK